MDRQLTTVNKRAVRQAVPKWLRQAVWYRWVKDNTLVENKCWVSSCSNVIRLDKAWHTAHVVPVCEGGETTVVNLRPVCAECNRDCQTQNLLKFNAVRSQGTKEEGEDKGDNLSVIGSRTVYTTEEVARLLGRYWDNVSKGLTEQRVYSPAEVALALEHISTRFEVSMNQLKIVNGIIFSDKTERGRRHENLSKRPGKWIVNVPGSSPEEQFDLVAGIGGVLAPHELVGQSPTKKRRIECDDEL